MDGVKADGRIRCHFERTKAEKGDQTFDLGDHYHLLMTRGKVDGQGRFFCVPLSNGFVLQYHYS